MDITIKSLKFDADAKLIAFIEKKVARLEKFHGGQTDVEVILSLVNDTANKAVKLKLHTPGESHIIERNSSSFEDAVTTCVDIMKEKLTRSKEKTLEK
ncbi:MAG: HPF/RaiA family ribosome-associated protein [Bacteroidales bacterium]|nr:HPF/RaiA family ribosome-associated protein [Bacteroidales bacterium]